MFLEAVTNIYVVVAQVIQLRKACSHPYLFPGIEPEPYEEGEHLVQVGLALSVDLVWFKFNRILRFLVGRKKKWKNKKIPCFAQLFIAHSFLANVYNFVVLGLIRQAGSLLFWTSYSTSSMLPGTVSSYSPR